MDDQKADEQRRKAITAWWEGMVLRNFIAAKRAALRQAQSTDVGGEK